MPCSRTRFGELKIVLIWSTRSSQSLATSTQLQRIVSLSKTKYLLNTITGRRGRIHNFVVGYEIRGTEVISGISLNSAKNS